jgi:uncharacterized protein YbjT (DUF2867 family)
MNAAGTAVPMHILVAGGTGFVGRHLVPALLDHGHTVRVMTRHPSDREDAATEVQADVSDPASLVAAMDGIDAAYYLVHTLDRDDFVERDRDGATNFAKQAASSDVRRVVYLGGLGDETDDLSPHLRSRREVEQILSAHVPTTALRAGIVVGDGSVSWEILCQLVERLPVMITPRWVQTKTQPIALQDVVAFLVAALGVVADGDSDHFEIGAPESLTYKQMVQAAADEMGRRLFVLPVPVLTPALSSHLAASDHRCRSADGAVAGRLDDERGRRQRTPAGAAQRPPTPGVPRGGEDRVGAARGAETPRDCRR